MLEACKDGALCDGWQVMRVRVRARSTAVEGESNHLVMLDIRRR